VSQEVQWERGDIVYVPELAAHAVVLDTSDTAAWIWSLADPPRHILFVGQAALEPAAQADLTRRELWNYLHYRIPDSLTHAARMWGYVDAFHHLRSALDQIIRMMVQIAQDLLPADGYRDPDTQALARQLWDRVDGVLRDARTLRKRLSRVSDEEESYIAPRN